MSSFRRNVAAGSLASAIDSSIRGPIQEALLEQPPESAEAAKDRVGELTNPAVEAAAQAAAQPSGKIGIETKPFLVALALFFTLLAIAIFLDWKNVVDDPKVYSGMVTTVLVP